MQPTDAMDAYAARWSDFVRIGSFCHDFKTVKSVCHFRFISAHETALQLPLPPSLPIPLTLMLWKMLALAAPQTNRPPPSDSKKNRTLCTPGNLPSPILLLSENNLLTREHLLQSGNSQLLCSFHRHLDELGLCHRVDVLSGLLEVLLQCNHLIVGQLWAVDDATPDLLVLFCFRTIAYLS